MTANKPEAHQPAQTAEPLALRLNDQLGPLLEDAAYACLMTLAGVDTYDVSLRDHGEAWEAIEAFAAKVKAAERERCAKLCDDAADRHRLRNSGKWPELQTSGDEAAEECAYAIRGPNAEVTG